MCNYLLVVGVDGYFLSLEKLCWLVGRSSFLLIIKMWPALQEFCRSFATSCFEL